jgi:SAM-dependent methyltransferase
MLRDRIKWQLFPGLNLHARLRFARLPEHFGSPTNGEERWVLDAGCGNGMLSYQSCMKGNHVIGVSLKEGEIARNKRLFNEYLGIPESRLQFRIHNLYEVDGLGRTFDEIICTEVLEHIVHDDQVCRKYFDILNPGGVLHLCCPNAEHPDNKDHDLDRTESGGHVRSGYTEASYRALLEPIGFEVLPPIGLGGPVRQFCNKRITNAQYVGRLPLGLATFATLAPFAALDGPTPTVPLSLYVIAKKPGL